MDDRIQWIDALKGITIFYVVWGHNYPGGYSVQTYLFSFHIPLFFFLSGYLFNSNKYDRFTTFLTSRLYSIVLPFIFFFLLTYIYRLFELANTLDHSIIFILSNEQIRPALCKKLLGLIYADRYWLNQIANIALWFLPCLFVTQNIFYLLNKLCNKKINSLFLLLFIISLCAYEISLLKIKQLPWSIDSSLTAVVFFGLGYIIKEKMKGNEHILSSHKKKILIVFFLSIITSLVVSQLNGRVDMNSNVYGDYILFYLAACSGIFTYIYFSKTILYRFKFLSHIGKNSIVIFALHLVVKGIAIDSLDFFVELFTDKDILVDINFYSFIIALLTVIYIIPLIYLLNKFSPFFIGKRKPF